MILLLVVVLLFLEGLLEVMGEVGVGAGGGYAEGTHLSLRKGTHLITLSIVVTVVGGGG